jgi:Dyp-type peroxidase family
LADQVASADKVWRFNEIGRPLDARRARKTAKLIGTWVNVAFSAPGLLALGRQDVAEFSDEAFHVGLPRRATSIGDPSDHAREGSPKNWKVGGTDDSIPHALLMIASDSALRLAKKVRALKTQITRSGGGLIVYEEKGGDLPGGLAGHEHFGFKDGISQPGVRGRMFDPPNPFLTHRLIADPQLDPAAPEFACPGQPLIWPGTFVFGYDSQDPSDARGALAGGPLGNSFPPWARNGSYLVFRRLRQDVFKFRQFLEDCVNDLKNDPAFGDLDAPRLAAMLVGRWPSGAPFARCPNADDETIGGDSFLNNHFGYHAAVPQVQLVRGSRAAGDLIPGAPGDPKGLLGPVVQHIRKVNPRDLSTEQANNTDVLRRRILRRGLPWGAPPADGATAATDNLKGDRGLLFLCYQASITEQFEFLCSNWMNMPNAPESINAGHDLLVGQNGQPGENRERRGVINRSKPGGDLHATILTHEDWVIATGGGYFFAPSISAMRDVVGAGS